MSTGAGVGWGGDDEQGRMRKEGDAGKGEEDMRINNFTFQMAESGGSEQDRERVRMKWSQEEKN
jgi:hypothetical protein